jgi:hypothetical protein
MNILGLSGDLVVVITGVAIVSILQTDGSTYGFNISI